MVKPHRDLTFHRVGQSVLFKGQIVIITRL